MKLPQLRELCKCTPGIHGVSSKTKAAIVTALLPKLPQLNLPAKRKLEDGELPNLKRTLFFPTSSNSQLLDFYNDHYGWLDSIDKDLYKMMLTTYHHTWEKTFGCAIFMLFIRNIWAMYEERTLLAKLTRIGSQTPSAPQETWNKLIVFIGNVCQQIVAL